MTLFAKPSIVEVTCTKDGGGSVTVSLPAGEVIVSAYCNPAGLGAAIIAGTNTVQFTPCNSCGISGSLVIETATDYAAVPVIVDCSGIGIASANPDNTTIGCLDTAVITVTGTAPFTWTYQGAPITPGVPFAIPGASVVVSAATNQATVTASNSPTVDPQVSALTVMDAGNHTLQRIVTVACSPNDLEILPSEVTVCSGQVDLVVQGGKAPYSWAAIDSPSGTMPATVGVQATFTATTTPGQVNAVVTDANGSSVQATIIISCDQTAITADQWPSSAQCGNAYTINISGGNPPYVVDTSNCDPGIIAVNGEITILAGTAAGNCLLKISDTPIVGGYDGQTIEYPINWTCASTDPLVLTPSVSTVICGGPVDLKATGGIAPYSFFLLPGEVGTIDVDPLDSSKAIYRAPGNFAGNVQINVSDSSAGGFGVIAFTTVAVSCPNLPLSVDRPRIALRCGQTVEITANGGPSTTYAWSTTCGALGTITPNPMTNGRSAFFTAAPGAGGLCTIVVTSGSSSIEIPVSLDCSPENPRIISGGGFFLCGEGRAIMVEGGTPPYAWAMSGCTGLATGPNAGSQILIQSSNTALGTCSLTVTDAQGKTDDIELNFLCFPPMLIGQPMCLLCGQSGQIVARGGKAPYTYQMATDDCGGKCSPGSTLSSTGMFTAGSEDGACHVRVTDATGYSINVPVIVVCPPVIVLPPLFVDFVIPPEVILVPDRKYDAQCSSDVLLSVSGGVAPYLWTVELAKQLGAFPALGELIVAGNTASAIFRIPQDTRGTFFVWVQDAEKRGKVSMIVIDCPQPCNPCADN